MEHLRFVVKTKDGQYFTGKRHKTFAPELLKAKVFARKCDASYQANRLNMFQNYDANGAPMKDAKVIEVRLLIEELE